MKELNRLKYFILLWFGQFVSTLGSSMTSFAMSIWAYEKTGSVLTLSISGMFIMAPRMIGGILAGPIIDRLNKKMVLFLTDVGSGLCTFILLLLLSSNKLEIWHIYCLNLLSSIFGSFQIPTNNVVVSMIVPKEYYVKSTGMQAFSNGTVQILSPVLASALLPFIRMSGVILFDLATLLFACSTLIAFVKIPAVIVNKRSLFNLRNYLLELKEGFFVIKDSQLLKTLISFLIFINFIAGMTYYNILSPMILARSDSNVQALGLVNGSLGIGNIVGGLFASFIPSPKNKIKTMFFCIGASFLLGDVLLALGNSITFWMIAGFLSSVFLPYFSANENYFWRTIIPLEMQGRTFAFKYAIQSALLPLGMLLGGVLADYVFEPMMLDNQNIITMILGSEKGSGMALMFLITGISGTIISIFGCRSKSLSVAESKLDGS